MKMRNRTRYDTKELRRVLCAVHGDTAKGSRGRLPGWNGLTVHVKSGKRFGMRFVSAGEAQLQVPKDGMLGAEFVAYCRFFVLYLHRIPVRDFPPTIARARPGDAERALAVRLKIQGREMKRRAVEPTAPKLPDDSARVAAIEAELVRAEARLDRWTSKLKRAETGIRSAREAWKKAKRKLRAYDATHRTILERSLAADFDTQQEPDA